MVHVERLGSGEPLLLIHGLGGDWRVWEPVLDRLTAEREVLAVDLPGFGSSPVLPEATTATPAALAAAVAETLDGLGIEQIDVAGNSLGGWVALELARMSSRAGTARVTRVTAICPAGFWGRPLGPRKGSVRALPRLLREAAPFVAGLPGFRSLGLSGVVAHPERVPWHAARRIVQTYLSAPGFDAANAAMRAGYLRLEDVSGLDVPVTLAWAERDRLVAPPRGGVPGVDTVSIPDAGHLAMWDQPAIVADLILRPVPARMPAPPAPPTRA